MESCNRRQTWLALNGPIVPPVAPLPLPDEAHPVSGDDHRVTMKTSHEEGNGHRRQCKSRQRASLLILGIPYKGSSAASLTRPSQAAFSLLHYLALD
jgi:hypothetical protein